MKNSPILYYRSGYLIGSLHPDVLLLIIIGSHVDNLSSDVTLSSRIIGYI